MNDPAHKETDRLLKEMEKRIAREYQQAEKEVSAKLADYLRRFKIKDKTWNLWVKTGQKTKKEYQEWRLGQMAIGARWEELRQNLADDYHNANQIAKSIINGYMPEVYAINHNYATYEVENQSMIDTSYTLYDRQTVERIMRDNPDLLPPPGKKVSANIAAGKDIRWNNQIIQSVMMQSLLQGESIGKIATRLAEAVGDSNRKAAIRNARTMTTGAENAGRVAGYRRAKAMGIKMKQQWFAIMDNRTRHEHRQLDGQIVEVGEPFAVDGKKIRFPGDPEAPGHLIWNCRCTLIGALDRFDNDISDRRNPELGSMTYEEWKKEKKSTSRPLEDIDRAERIIKGAYINEYRNGGKPLDSGGNDGIINRKVFSMARKVVDVEDLKKVSKSPIVGFKKNEDIERYFKEKYNIDIIGFSNKDLFDVQKNMAGIDDILLEFPEAKKYISVVKYSPRMKDYGSWDRNGTIKISKTGLGDYGTGVHEAAHALGYELEMSGSGGAKEIIERARKSLGMSKNEFSESAYYLTQSTRDAKDQDEVFAYGIEAAKARTENALANEIYKEAKRNHEARFSKQRDRG